MAELQKNGMASTAPQTVTSPNIGQDFGFADNSSYKFVGAGQGTTGINNEATPISVTPPKVSTTTISNANKIQQVPGIVNTTNQLAKTGVTTDVNGTATYANGTLVPQVEPDVTPATPPKPTPVSTGGYYGDVYVPPGAPTPAGPDGKPALLTQTSPSDDQILNSLNALKSQNDAITASVIDGIHAQYARLRQQQESASRSAEKRVGNALLMGGATGKGSSSQFAPISSSGILQAQINYGLNEIADLNGKEQSAVLEAQNAGQQNNFQLMDKINNQISKIRDEKVAAATKLNDQIREENKKVAEKEIQSSRDDAVASLYQQGVKDVSTLLDYLNYDDKGKKVGDFTAKEVRDAITNIGPTVDELNRQQAAIKFAVDNKVKKQFYLVGNTAVDTATGEKVSLAEFQRRTGQVVGLPEDQTDFSELQTDIQTPSDRELQFKQESEVFDRYVKERQLTLDEQKVANDGAINFKDMVKYQTDLRKEFNALPQVKDYNNVKQSVQSVKSGYDQAKSAGGDQRSKAAADQILVVGFNKLIDPGSVVREGEFARSTEGQSLINRLKGKADAAISGGVGLTDQDRESIKDAVDRLYTDYLKSYATTAQQYRGYASELQADPDKIVKIGNEEAQLLLDSYVKDNPSKLQAIEQIEKDNPNISDLDILQVLGAPGFEQVGSDTNKAPKSQSFIGPVNPSYSDLQKRNLSYAPDIDVPKVNIGAGAAVKNNNPGNLRNKDGSWMKFSTPEEGFKGLMGYLERAKAGDHTAYKPTQTLYQFFAKYAPAADSNNPKSYAEAVAKRLGISPNTTINKLDTFAWAKEIARHESSTNIA